MKISVQEIVSFTQAVNTLEELFKGNGNSISSESVKKALEDHHKTTSKLRFSLMAITKMRDQFMDTEVKVS